MRDHGQNTKSRESAIRLIYSSTDNNLVLKTLIFNKIKYVYVSKGVDLKAKDGDFLQKVFHNEKATIYKDRS